MSATDIPALDLAAREIERYTQMLVGLVQPLSYSQLWHTDAGIHNSVGTLLLHLTGNLNHYFGASILQNGYVCERDKESSERGLPLTTLVSDLQTAVLTMKTAVATIDERNFPEPYIAPAANSTNHCATISYAYRRILSFTLGRLIMQSINCGLD
ncbi:MAG: hypothetical protein AAF614_00045 [Chloroflexota bacterium]